MWPAMVGDVADRKTLAQPSLTHSWGASNRQFDDEAGAIWLCRLDADITIHDGDQMFDDGQAEASPSHGTGAPGVDAIKALEDAVPVFCRNARAVVFDLDDDALVVMACTHDDVADLRGVLGRIVEEVRQDLFETAAVGKGDDIAWDINHDAVMASVDDGLQVVDDALDDVGHPDRAHGNRMTTRFDAGEVEEV
jgi:hypothetical protein